MSNQPIFLLCPISYLLVILIKLRFTQYYVVTTDVVIDDTDCIIVTKNRYIIENNVIIFIYSTMYDSPFVMTVI